jgi:hypothetical protein
MSDSETEDLSRYAHGKVRPPEDAPPPIEEPAVRPMDVQPNERTVINMQRERRTIS